jgi:hypothetical protein
MNALNFVDWLKNFAYKLPWLGLALLLIIVIAVFLSWTIRVIGLRRLMHEKFVLLELTPPAHTNKTPDANDQFVSILHGLGMRRSFRDRLTGRLNVYSAEVISTRAEGIRFVVRVSRSHASAVEHFIHAHLAEVKVKRIKEYLPKSLDGSILSFHQHGHYAYPLARHDSLEHKDPIAYLTSAMTKLEDNELIAMQLVLTPVRVREATILRAKILHNENLQQELQGRQYSLLRKFAQLLGKILMAFTDLVREVQNHGTGGDHYTFNRDVYERKQASEGIRPARTLTSFEQELVQSMHHKLSQSLFQTDIRFYLKLNTKDRLLTRESGIDSALESFTVPSYQGLQRHSSLANKLLANYSQRSFALRLPSLFNKRSNLLASSEISSLYHFPHSRTANTENVIKSLSKTLPAPVSLKNGSKLDIVLGENKHQGTITPIGLSEAERERHVYIIGGTGNGKTTMLLYGIVQDINSGKGVAVLDPHGDLAESILRHIPEDRIKDVIYLNPDDISQPIGLNLLELPDDLEGDDLLREKDLVTESTISVMRKIFSTDDSGGHRVEYILRNTIQTALTVKDATLFTIFDLLNNPKYRRSITKDLEDKDLKNFWDNELSKAGDFQKVKMSAGITAKIGRFLFSASAKRVLEQPKSTIDFDDILDSGKILICNFSKGLLGEDTSTLFGTTVLAKLQIAALRRARKSQRERRSFYLYVDEFQNFATTSFVQMLSEARKYKLFLTMAEQSTSQQDQQRLVDIILANVGTVICFRSGSPADERLVLPLFSRYLEQGEIANLPAYSFYARIAALQAQEPMSGMTILLEDYGSDDVANLVKAQSRKEYGREYKPPKQALIQQTTKKTNNKKSTSSKESKLANTSTEAV